MEIKHALRQSWYSHSNHLVDFFALKIIIEKNLFIIVDTEMFEDIDSSIFEELCKNIQKLFVEQIAVDITIAFKSHKSNKKPADQCLKKYSLHFGCTKFLAEYKKPQCKTHLCIPRDRSLAYLQSEITSHGRSFVLRATNVEYI